MNSLYKKLNGYFTPYLVFTLNQLIDLMKEDDSIEKTMIRINAFEKEVKEVADHGWGNQHLFIKNSYGDLFKFMLSKEYLSGGRTNNLYVLTLWSYNDHSLGHFILKDKYCIENKDVVLDKVAKRTERFSQGYVPCSNCEKEEKIKDIEKNRYFAGIYCNECWERKYKAIEAKENYN